MSKKRNPNGMGTYKQRSDGRVEWRQKIDGQERYLSAKTMKELQEKVKQIADLPIIKEKYTADEWFQKWLDVYVKPLKKAATYNQYNTLYNTHIKPVIGNRKLTNLKNFDLQSVIAAMNENGKSSKTMKHVKSIMKIALTKAFDDKVIAKNPFEKIEIPVKQAKPRKTLSVEELSKLFNSMGNSRWIWSVKFMLVTGLRRGELLALKWIDIDWENRRITVDESNSQTGLGDTKSAKIHYVPLSQKAIEYLRGQLDMLKSENNPITINKNSVGQVKDLNGTDYLIFPTEKGKMIKPNTYYHTISRFAEKAGIKATPHCLRHTFVFMSRETLSLKEIQAILGHDESTTTLDIYGDILNETTDKTASQIDNIFSKVDLEITKAQEENIKKEGKVIQLFRAK